MHVLLIWEEEECVRRTDRNWSTGEVASSKERLRTRESRIIVPPTCCISVFHIFLILVFHISVKRKVALLCHQPAYLFCVIFSSFFLIILTKNICFIVPPTCISFYIFIPIRFHISFKEECLIIVAPTCISFF